MRPAVHSRPLAVAGPTARRTRPGQRRAAAAGLAVGLTLTGIGGLRLDAELHRQRVLAPLTEPGGWQRAVVADGVRVVADRVDRAARRVGNADAWRDGAAVLGFLAAATGDAATATELRSRSLDLAVRSLDRAPGSARAHLLAGAALADGNTADTSQATVHLDRAAALDPNSAALRRQLGYVALSRDRGGEAVTHFRAALAADPTNARLIYETLNLFATPLSPIDVTPRTVASQSALGTWLEDEGDVESAHQAFATSLVLADAGEEDARAGAAHRAYARLQGHLFRQRDWRAARRLAGARLADGRHADDDERALLHHHRGVALLQEGRPAEALADLSRAIDLAPTRLPYRDAQARALAALSRHQEAAETWKAALALPRRTEREARWEPAMRLARARSLLAVPRPGPAVDELRAVLSRDPMNAEARRLLEELGL